MELFLNFCGNLQFVISFEDQEGVGSCVVPSSACQRNGVACQWWPALFTGYRSFYEYWYRPGIKF